MVEDASDDLGPHALPLVGSVDDHVPDCCTIDKVGEYSTESDETVPVPCTESQIGMAKHFLRIIKRSALGPWSLVEQPKELRCIGRLAMGVGDGGLEGWRHLILEYPPNCFGVYGETDVNASPNLLKMLPTDVVETGGVRGA
jgi:hypothetical protein